MTHRVNAVLIKTTEIFVDINKLFPKSIWKSKGKEKPKQALGSSNGRPGCVFSQGTMHLEQSAVHRAGDLGRHIGKFSRKFKSAP